MLAGGAALPPGLTDLIVSPEHQAALLQAAQVADVPGAPVCATAHYATTGEVGIVEPLALDAAGHVSDGAWKEQIRETGCGMDRMLNVLSVAKPDGTVSVEPLLPGSTITDPKLQEDSVPVAAQGMGGLPPGCDAGAVLDTRFDGMEGLPPGVPPGPGQPLRPWTETWTLEACGKRAPVTLRFSPGVRGTEIRLVSPPG